MIASAQHRPWPLPRWPWMMFMRWNDLAFLHWAVDPAILHPHLPPGLPLDTFDGKAWLGITPFEMSNTRPRFLPPVPGLSTFPEINLRTYVTLGGKAGIWFLSLDADNYLAVRAARFGFLLPYHDAKMSIERSGNGISYSSERQNGNPEAKFVARYRPVGDVYRSQPGSLDYWLTERYCLYVYSKNRVYRGDIHHAQWPLQRGEAEIEFNSLADAKGIKLTNPPLIHFAKQLDVVGWYLVPAD